MIEVAPLEEQSQSLLAIAQKVEAGALKPKQVWIAINGARAYSAFQFVMVAAGMKYVDYLGSVLRKQYDDPTKMSDLLRRAAVAMKERTANESR